MEYSEYKRNSRVAVDTSDIDAKNFKTVSDISEIATQQLKNFDQTYTATTSPAENYKKFREEIIGMSQDEGSFQVEIGPEEFVPTLLQKREEVVEEKKVSFALNLKGKLLISVCASILVLLSVLLIYNAVLIGSYNAQIAEGTQILSEVQFSTETLENELSAIMQDSQYSAEGMGLSNQANEQIILNTFEKRDRIVYTEETNWFDDICDFISSIFGG